MNGKISFVPEDETKQWESVEKKKKKVKLVCYRSTIN